MLSPSAQYIIFVRKQRCTISFKYRAGFVNTVSVDSFYTIKQSFCVVHISGYLKGVRFSSHQLFHGSELLLRGPLNWL